MPPRNTIAPDQLIKNELARVRSSKMRNAADFKKHGVKPINRREEAIALCASLDAREHLLVELSGRLNGN